MRAPLPIGSIYKYIYNRDVPLGAAGGFARASESGVPRLGRGSDSEPGHRGMGLIRLNLKLQTGARGPECVLGSESMAGRLGHRRREGRHAQKMWALLLLAAGASLSYAANLLANPSFEEVVSRYGLAGPRVIVDP